MKRTTRLKKANDFQVVRRCGRSWIDKRLVLLTLQNNVNYNRTGIAVGKRIGNAVTRNCIKRRIREAIRATQVQQGWDLVFIARNGSSRSNFDGLVDSVTSLCERAGILERTQENHNHMTASQA